MGVSGLLWAVRVLVLLQLVTGILGWGKEGHYATCKIAEGYLTAEALAAVKGLLPESAEGDLANVCSWPDMIRFHYHWSSALHYVDTPDFRCNYGYCRDCHDSSGRKDRCVTGAIYNYTRQLSLVYQNSNSESNYNLTEALMFLSHFIGDVHQPLHVGFLGDLGGNTIQVRWYHRKSNLHHVWDTMIIESALKTFYSSDLATMIQAIQNNITENWSNQQPSWEHCAHNHTVCPNPYASESISLACKFAYRNATPGSTLEGALGWSKEGHIMTCRIAQNLLGPEAAHAVENLLPHNLNGDLSALCIWPDQIRHWYRYRWTSPLHFIDTPDEACTFDYSRDCVKDACVDGAIQNFTSQLLHYRDGTGDRRYNLTEALLFLSHFMGDIHQPMHVGFTSDEGGNTIELRWFRHKSNLHHVWDREIILTALKDFYDNDMDLLQETIEGNFTDGIWFDDVASWKDCGDLLSCPDKYATESINIACKWGYEGVKEGVTLADDYFNSRMPIVMKRIAQGGVRLAMFLNRIFGDPEEGFASPT